MPETINKFEKYNLKSLRPKDSISNDAFFILDQKMKDENIKNIAISGPYSSGKSSFVDSYLKYRNDIKESEYLKISLATFNGVDGKKKGKIDSSDKKKKDITHGVHNDGEDAVCDVIDKENDSDGNSVSNYIEKTIIEKLYYSNYKVEIFKNITKMFVLFVAMFTIIFFIFDCFIIKKYRQDILNAEFLRLRYIAIASFYSIILLSVLATIIYIANKSTHFIKKVAFKGLEIEDKNVENENLLNKNLELIIKQFRLKKYKYVIFDDIDRFNNTLIFERLRDLNITLNMVLKEKVVFIYEIKDSLFENQDRTKFFDFIMPIIPYVGYDNSVDKINNALLEQGLSNDISPILINGISMFLFDYRLITNIINEYIIFKESLNKNNYNLDQLFAMTVYKNTCPGDYIELQDGKGKIYNLFHQKKEIINNKVTECSKKLEELLGQKRRNSERDEYISILRNILYNILKYNEEFSISRWRSIKITNHTNNQTFVINSIDQYIEIPEYIIISQTDSIEMQNNSYRKSLRSILLSEGDNNQIYNDTIKRIENVDKFLDKKISETRKKIEEISGSSMVMLTEDDSTILKNLKLGSYTELIKFLIKEGYIDENYAIYMSKYEESNISMIDYDFIANVRTNNPLFLYDKKLEHPKNIIDRLGKNEFKKPQILNISIAETLFNNEIFNDMTIMHEVNNNSRHINLIKEDRRIKKINFITTLCSHHEEIHFLHVCFEKMENNIYKDFINALFKEDNNLCSKVIQSEIKKESKDSLINSIVTNISGEKIKNSSNYSDVIKYISENQILLNEDYNLIKDYEVKYTNLVVIKNTNITLYDKIVKGWNYILNEINIKCILNNNVHYITNNLEMISTNSGLYSYVKIYINKYIESIYSVLEEQKSNNEALIKILQNENLKEKNKMIIMAKEKIPIDDISKISDDNWDDLISYDLFAINLENINNYYLKFGFNDTIIGVINSLNTNTLCKDIDKILSIKLIKEILLSENINEEIIDYISNNSNCSLNPDDLPEDRDDEFLEKRIIKLIKNGNICFYNQMIERLRTLSSNVWLELLEKYKSRTTSILKNKEIVFSNDEISKIVLSKQTDIGKYYAICQYNFDDNSNLEEDVKKEVIRILLQYISYKIYFKDSKVLENILKSKATRTNEKVRLVNEYFFLVDAENIKRILKSINYLYSNLVENGMRPKISNNKENQKLINNILSLGYKIEKKSEDTQNITIKGNWDKDKNIKQ